MYFRKERFVSIFCTRGDKFCSKIQKIALQKGVMINIHKYTYFVLKINFSRNLT